MKLLEYLKINNDDVDFYDTDYDISVTVCFDADDINNDDAYYKFLVKLYDTVEIVSKNTVNWSGLIENNAVLFQEFMKRNWKIQYSDKDDFVCSWISELNVYCAGMVNDFIYNEMLKLLDKCQYIEMKKER